MRVSRLRSASSGRSLGSTIRRSSFETSDRASRRLRTLPLHSSGRAGQAHIASLDPVPIGLPQQLGPGVYLLKVRALADDRDPVDCTVMLGVPEGWQGLTISPYSDVPNSD